MGFVCAIDTGGTFTDCVVLDSSGGVTLAKVPSTPDDYSKGVFDAFAEAARDLRTTVEDLLGDTAHVLVGTTVGTNAMVTRRGARVGMIVTRGHSDALHIMRGHGRVSGLPISQALAPYLTSKPDPIVPRSCIVEVDERVDCFGEVVVALNPDQVREATTKLLDQGVEAVAICFLWSFLNPKHEVMAKQVVQEVARELFVCTSCEVAPRWGEYERWTAAAMNARLGPLTGQYVDGVAHRLEDLGYRGQLLLMACSGGSLPAPEAKRLSILLLGSGPVGGVVGTAYLAKSLSHPNVIATDMGGTSFDVGLVREYEPVRNFKSIVGQYEYYVPNVDVRSIGSGGGSIAWVDPITHRLQVGPQSAGADPGPACYGRGGRAATVTDANVVLGLINPDHFLGGAMRLDADAAWQAVSEVAEQLNLDPVKAASGIVRIVDALMADLLRKMTIEKGFHPEDFVLYSYGGAGGLHASSFARELGVKQVVIPLSNLASVWSAYGIASSDLFHFYQSTKILSAPFDPGTVNTQIETLEAQATGQLLSEGVPKDRISLRRFASMRYTLQVHELVVPLPPGLLTAHEMDAAIVEFERTYEQRYGKGSGYREAGFELATVAVEATGALTRPVLAPVNRQGASRESARRKVYWAERDAFVDSPVYRQSDMNSGVVVEGPAVIELSATTIAVRPGDRCWLNEYGSLLMEVGRP